MDSPKRKNSLRNKREMNSMSKFSVLEGFFEFAGVLFSLGGGGCRNYYRGSGSIKLH